jgi:hypothetical protein
MNNSALTFMIIVWGLIIGSVFLTLFSLFKHEKKNKVK